MSSTNKPMGTPKKLTAIYAVDRNGFMINHLTYRCRDTNLESTLMSETEDGILVMSQEALSSLGGGVRGRSVVVLSKVKLANTRNVRYFTDTESLLNYLSKQRNKESFVFLDGELTKELEPYITSVTRVTVRDKVEAEEKEPLSDYKIKKRFYRSSRIVRYINGIEKVILCRWLLPGRYESSREEYKYNQFGD